MAGRLSSRILLPSALSEADRQLWDQLCLDDPDLACPFLTRAYAQAAERVYDTVRVCVLEQQGRPVGFFPFQRLGGLRGLFGQRDPLVTEVSDYVGLVAPQDLQVSPEDLLIAMGGQGLYFTHLAEFETRHGLTGEQPRVGLRICLPQGGNAYWNDLAHRNAKFASDTTRRERRLVESLGPLRFVFRHADPMPELEALFERKLALFKRTGVADALIKPRNRDFLRELARCEDPSCRGTMTTLHAGETWVASHFGLEHHGRLQYWFSVYNPELSAFSPGRMMLRQMILAASDCGITMIDRGEGDSQATRDMADFSHHFLRGLWLRPGPTALAIRALFALEWRWQVLLRSRQRVLSLFRPQKPGPGQTSAARRVISVPPNEQ